MNTVLQEWISEQLVRDEMLWKGAYASQMMFLRDRVQFLIGAGLPFGESANLARVISTHRSKSIDLPVVRLDRPDLGISFVMRAASSAVPTTRGVMSSSSSVFSIRSPVEPNRRPRIGILLRNGIPVRVTWRDCSLPSLRASLSTPETSCIRCTSKAFRPNSSGATGRRTNASGLPLSVETTRFGQRCFCACVRLGHCQTGDTTRGSRTGASWPKRGRHERA